MPIRKGNGSLEKKCLDGSKCFNVVFPKSYYAFSIKKNYVVGGFLERCVACQTSVVHRFRS